mmetsp:Transcript_7658/g.11373  ORF Transcript_7658/g.11373 Transcript_7658/m.11373 type:complete len:278 (+) Transcript_7658:1-834(+)
MERYHHSFFDWYSQLYAFSHAAATHHFSLPHLWRVYTPQLQACFHVTPSPSLLPKLKKKRRSPLLMYLANHDCFTIHLDANNILGDSSMQLLNSSLGYGDGGKRCFMLAITRFFKRLAFTKDQDVQFMVYYDGFPKDGSPLLKKSIVRQHVGKSFHILFSNKVTADDCIVDALRLVSKDDDRQHVVITNDRGLRSRCPSHIPSFTSVRFMKACVAASQLSYSLSDFSTYLSTLFYHLVRSKDDDSFALLQSSFLSFDCLFARILYKAYPLTISRKHH